MEYKIKELKDIINDLTLVLSLYIDNYPFDEDHKKKHKILVNDACFAIDKPRTVKELIKMCNLEEKTSPEILEKINKEES